MRSKDQSINLHNIKSINSNINPINMNTNMNNTQFSNFELNQKDQPKPWIID